MPEFRALLSVESEMAQRIRAHDWSRTSFGPPEYWPQSLRSALSICLNSPYPASIYWGPDLCLLYNDAWSVIPGPRHPAVLGQPAREVWPDIWHIVEPQLRSVLTTGKGFVTRDQMLPMTRHGAPEETYWDYSFTPIAGEDGSVAGIFNQGQDSTERVLTTRRSNLMLALSDRVRPLEASHEVLSTALEIAGTHLNVGRIFYGEAGREDQLVSIEACWSQGEMAPIAGAIGLDLFGPDVQDSLHRGEAVIIHDVHADARVKDGCIQDTLIDMDVRSMILAPIIRNGICATILGAQHAHPRHWSPHDVNLLRSVAGRTWHELSRARAAMALRESERRHRLIFEQARDIIFTADLEQQITACNPAAAAAIGLPAEEIVGHNIADFIPPEEFEKTSAMLRQKLSDGGMTRYEVSIYAGGRIRQWDINSALTIDLDGNPIGLHAVARDVTDQRAFEEQQKLLINELNHRVKNTLALVQGLATQSFKQNRTVAEGQEAFQARLRMLAAGHDLLTQQKWEGAPLAALVADATAPYADPPGRILAHGDHVILAPQAAISLGMALHELGTNAAKYGALSTPNGRIVISWALGENHLFTFLWRETGGPPVTIPERQGFGLRMIERALSSDLEGKVTVDFQPEGITCRITAKLPELS
jgi:PAS domain S-box-containing protein